MLKDFHLIARLYSKQHQGALPIVLLGLWVELIFTYIKDIKMKQFDILIENLKDIDSINSKFTDAKYPFHTSIAKYTISRLILSEDKINKSNSMTRCLQRVWLAGVECEAKCSLLAKFNILPDNSAEIIKQLTAIDKIVSKVNRDNITQIGCSFYTDSFSVVVIFKSNNDRFDIDFTIIDGNTIDKVITYYNREIQDVWNFKEKE